MLNVRTVIVSKVTSHCVGTVQMREESESGIRKWEEMWCIYIALCVLKKNCHCKCLANYIKWLLLTFPPGIMLSLSALFFIFYLYDITLQCFVYVNMSEVSCWLFVTFFSSQISIYVLSVYFMIMYFERVADLQYCCLWTVSSVQRSELETSLWLVNMPVVIFLLTIYLWKVTVNMFSIIICHSWEEH